MSRTGELVGRAEELAVLERALAAASDGTAVVVEVVGEPGIGKTRLLAELGRRAEEERRLVLAGQASELERDLPYWIFVDALDEYLRTLDPPELAEVDARCGGELGRIFPSLPHAVAAPAGLLDERYRVHHAVRLLLERLADPRPLVLLLDDLHWADPASVDLVAALLRRPPQAPALLALALRAGQASPRLAAALEQRDRAGLLARLELRPLGEAEAEQLVGPQRARLVYAESGGNPFYLEQLARAPADARGPAPSTADTALAGVPEAVAVALGEEVAGLSEEARRLLEAGAVVGDPFELDFAVAAAGTRDADALAALDGLLRQGLLARTDAPRRFRFRHPLLRRAVYDATAIGWRTAAHERAARALAAHGEPAAVRARHVVQFARLGDRDAIAVLCEAADASAGRAPASAARWYRAALDLLPAGDADRDERADLLERLARALVAVGRFVEGHAAFEEVLALVPPDGAARLRLVAACADVEHLLGEHAAAHERLVAALEQLPDQDSPEAVALLLDLGMDAFYGRDYEGMRAWGVRALERVEGLADEPLRAAATAMVSVACAFTGEVAEAQRLRDEAALLVDALADEQLALRLDAVANLGNAETYLDRFEDAVRHLDRGLEVGRATGQGRLFPLLMQRKGFALVLLGRLAEAVDVLDRAVETARLSGSRQAVAWALLNRAWAALGAGDLDTALAAAEESVALGHDLDDSPVLTWSACALGAALVEAGEPARCLAILVPAGGGPDLPLIPGELRVIFLERVAHALLALGRTDEAEEVVAQAEASAAQLGLGLAAALASRARAAASLAAGDAAAAAGAALEGATAAEAVRARVEAARARTLAGRALVAAGERERGAAELARAAAELEASGALRYRDEAERELRRLGRRHHRRRGSARAAGEGLGALTARELEVAELVRDRKTNREIAAALFLSEKTVETHLRHIFGKLGVSTRASVARELEAREKPAATS